KIVQRDPLPSDVRREVGWSLLTGGIFGLVGAVTIWLASLGVTQVYLQVDDVCCEWDHGWTWFWCSIPLAIIVHDTYFYWTHRLMHHRALFRWFHRVHHQSRNPSPWARYCSDPLEGGN